MLIPWHPLHELGTNMVGVALVITSAQAIAGWWKKGHSTLVGPEPDDVSDGDKKARAYDQGAPELTKEVLPKE